ncbi:unnamed protein product, partial [Pylaiella littoralis]
AAEEEQVDEGIGSYSNLGTGGHTRPGAEKAHKRAFDAVKFTAKRLKITVRSTSPRGFAAEQGGDSDTETAIDPAADPALLPELDLALLPALDPALLPVFEPEAAPEAEPAVDTDGGAEPDASV